MTKNPKPDYPPEKKPSEAVIAIDLHGTLLDENWSVAGALLPRLCSLMRRLKDYCDFYICTGNNRSFVEQHVPAAVRDLVTGYILETGSVYSDKETEEIVISANLVDTIKSLETKLQALQLPQVLFFAERKASVSLFTRHKKEGESPEKLYHKIKLLLKELGNYDQLQVTHSDVAVDIISSDVSKFTGLHREAGSRKIIAVADSLNDIDLLLNADLAFVPSNSFRFEQDDETKQLFSIKNLESFLSGENHSQNLYRANSASTAGLLEILECLLK